MWVHYLQLCRMNAESESLTCAIALAVSCGLEVVRPRKTCRNAEIQLVVTENLCGYAPVGLSLDKRSSLDASINKKTESCSKRKNVLRGDSQSAALVLDLNGAVTGTGAGSTACGFGDLAVGPSYRGLGPRTSAANCRIGSLAALELADQGQLSGIRVPATR